MSNYTALRDRIQTGDLIAFDGKGWISWVIKRWQRYPISHVGVVVNIDAQGRVMVMESTTLNGKKGVQLNRLSKRVKGYKGTVNWFPLHRKTRDKLDVTAMQNYLWEQDGKPYDTKQAIKAGLWSWTTRENGSELFCSELVAGAWRAGKILSKKTNISEVTPEKLCRMLIFRKTFVRLN